MKRIVLELTDELATVLDATRGKQCRNPLIENLLWEADSIKAAASKLKIARPNRRPPGRPKVAVDAK